MHTEQKHALPSDDAPSRVRVVLPAGEVARAGLVVLGLVLATYILWHIHEVVFLLFLGILLATGAGLGPTPLFVACALAVVAALCSLARFRSVMKAGGTMASPRGD